MKFISTEKLEKSQVKIKFVIEAKTFNAEVTKQFAKQAKNITLPGFRKGKAPRSIIEKMYGKGVFYDDALNAILPDEYEVALKESGVDALGTRPAFDIDEISDEGEVTVLATLAVKPEIAIEGYKGIEAAKIAPEITDEMIDSEIDAVRQRNARTIDVTDRAAQDGDTATIDYSGSVDGVKFDGGTAEGHDLRLGSGSFIPGFEEQIIGKNIGDSFDVNVTFPTEYHAEELAGKEAVFAVTLHAIKETQLPVLDDEFAKDVSTFDTFAEYRADATKKIQERADTAAEQEFEGKLMDALIDKIDGDIPEDMIEMETDNFVRDFETRLRMQGMDFKMYMQFTGMDAEALRADMRPQAERQVKGRLALEKIADLENLAVDKDAVEAEYNKLAETYNMSVDEIKGMIPEADLEKDLRVKLAVALVKTEAVKGNE
ncbi:MAG: trigger factor [Oscillospiraceae bacterium]|nr:trigger factor [Oscillospiraceae bacterium]